MAFESLSVLSSCVEVCVIIVGLLLAIVGGAALAVKLMPLDASESENMLSYDNYLATQEKLSVVRAERARIVAEFDARRSSDPNAVTKANDLVTQVDRSLDERFSSIPLRTVSVS